MQATNRLNEGDRVRHKLTGIPGVIVSSSQTPVQQVAVILDNGRVTFWFRDETEIVHLTAEGQHIVEEAVRNARQAMEPGKNTRNNYGAGALDALERLADRLGVPKSGT